MDINAPLSYPPALRRVVSKSPHSRAVEVVEKTIRTGVSDNLPEMTPHTVTKPLYSGGDSTSPGYYPRTWEAPTAAYFAKK